MLHMHFQPQLETCYQRSSTGEAALVCTPFPCGSSMCQSPGMTKQLPTRLR